MKLWHLSFVVLLLAMMMAIARDEIGRVALVVFLTGIALIVLGVSSLMMLFRTVAALGSAETLSSSMEALAATAAVLLIGAASMWLALWVGLGLIWMMLG